MVTLTDRLLNDYQHSFPLVSEPFGDLARQLGTDVATTLSEVRQLKASGTISRIGPVFKPNTVGVSTLAALSVPRDQLDHYAQIVNRFPQVNHNYEREHEINLWFVLTAADQDELDETIHRIEDQTGHEVLVLPLLREYHIDLGFNLYPVHGRPINGRKPGDDARPAPSTLPATSAERKLIAAIQGGLPLVERPYQALAEQLDMSESELLGKLRALIDTGAIKRFGVIVRHHEMGYRANAMVVWDVPDNFVELVGQKLGSEDCVTLCYQRPRVLPRWPYNLFCMIHGKDRSQVMECIRRIRRLNDLEHVPHQVLFSGKRFKQRGARYHRPGKET